MIKCIVLCIWLTSWQPNSPSRSLTTRSATIVPRRSAGGIPVQMLLAKISTLAKNVIGNSKRNPSSQCLFIYPSTNFHSQQVKVISMTSKPGFGRQNAILSESLMSPIVGTCFSKLGLCFGTSFLLCSSLKCSPWLQ